MISDKKIILDELEFLIKQHAKIQDIDILTKGIQDIIELFKKDGIGSLGLFCNECNRYVRDKHYIETLKQYIEDRKTNESRCLKCVNLTKNYMCRKGILLYKNLMRNCDDFEPKE